MTQSYMLQTKDRQTDRLMDYNHSKSSTVT